MRVGQNDTDAVGARGESIDASVAALRAAIYAEARREELAELDTDLAALEAEEGITSAELAAGIARGELTVTMRRAWWLARWRLRERLVATARACEAA